MVCRINWRGIFTSLFYKAGGILTWRLNPRKAACVANPVKLLDSGRGEVVQMPNDSTAIVLPMATPASTSLG